MTIPTMTLTEAANRLLVLADAYNDSRLEIIGPDSVEPGFVVSRLELEAVTFAAAFLGVFAESLDNADEMD